MRNFFSLRAYLKFLERNKLFAFINIIGFAASMAFVVLLVIYLAHEFSIDKFHAKGDRIFRYETDGGIYVAPKIALDLKDRYPEIEEIVRIKGGDHTLTDKNDTKIQVTGLWADSSFFDVFSFRLVEGDPRSVMQTRADVVLTESFARRIFGSVEAAAGQDIVLDERHYMVSGVAADFQRTHFNNPDVIMRYEEIERNWSGQDILTSYNNNSFYMYLLIRENADFESKLPDVVEFFKGYYWLFQWGNCKEVILTPVDRVYKSSKGAEYMSQGKSTVFMGILVITVIIILLFAVINYINLSVSLAGFRAKEAATRRLVGGTRRQLFAGFITESTVMCAVSFLLALVMAYFIRPWFVRVLGTEIDFSSSITPFNIGLAASFVIMLGVVSGLIPATIVTRFNPIDVVRGTFRRQSKMVFSKVFIVFQYFITVLLIGSTMVILQQTEYMKTTDLGYNKDNIVIIGNTLPQERVSGIADALMTVAGVEKVSLTQGIPFDGGNNNTGRFDGKAVGFQIFQGDSAYMDLMGFEILKRSGNPDEYGVWLNQTAYRQMELPEDATEFQMEGWGNPTQLKGMVKDFHYRDMSESIGPTQVGRTKWGPWNILVKVSGDDPYAVMKRVEEEYARYSGNTAFSARFSNDVIKRQYGREDSLTEMVSVLALLAILISSLGMLAMSTYFIRQRAQEVAVRKVFGSTERQIIGRLVMSFLKLVIIAFVLAVPVIWYLMNEWLKQYAYHIKISWLTFILAGIVALAVAGATVLWQSYRAAVTDPIKAMYK